MISNRLIDELVRLMEVGDARGAADFIRDVHWSYEVQRPFIERYYVDEADVEDNS